MKKLFGSLLLLCSSLSYSSDVMKTELQILPSVINSESIYYVHTIKGTDIRDGAEIDFYDDDKVKVICNYENGKLNGMWIHFNRDGSMCFEIQFINDKPDGLKRCIKTNETGDFYELTCGCDL